MALAAARDRRGRGEEVAAAASAAPAALVDADAATTAPLATASDGDGGGLWALPPDVLSLIASWLSARDVLALRAACTGSRAAADNDACWSPLFTARWPVRRHAAVVAYVACFCMHGAKLQAVAKALRVPHVGAEF